MEEYTIARLSEMLRRGETTCKQLTAEYLERIREYDGYLHSVGELLPDALAQAEQLDREREETGPRSPLHGIPILLKDNMNVCGPLHTCAGSHALGTMVAQEDATVAKKLRDAGMLILGKANLSEFAYFMSTKAPCGFSSQFGQVKSPYDERIDPLGSSTGSAVAVAANLIPVAIGSETNGSLMSPSLMNSICSLKPTLGLVSRWGILPITAAQDTAGPMSRTVEDSAYLMDVLWGMDEKDEASLANPRNDYHFRDACHASVRGKRLGILRFASDRPSEERETALENAKAVFSRMGVTCVDVTLPGRRIDNMETLLHEFKKDLNAYLKSMGDAAPLHSLEEIIRFNKQDPQRCIPYGQDILEMAQEKSGMLTEEVYLQARERQLKEAGLLEELLIREELDAVAAVNPFPHGAIGGNPTMIVPAKKLLDLTPMSVVFAARKWQDDVLFTFAQAYEQATAYRVAPDLSKLPKE